MFTIWVERKPIKSGRRVNFCLGTKGEECVGNLYGRSGKGKRAQKNTKRSNSPINGMRSDLKEWCRCVGKKHGIIGCEKHVSQFI